MQNPESIRVKSKQKEPKIYSNVLLTVNLSFLNIPLVYNIDDESCLLKDVKTKISKNQEKIMLKPII